MHCLHNGEHGLEVMVLHDVRRLTAIPTQVALTTVYCYAAVDVIGPAEIEWSHGGDQMLGNYVQ